MHAAQQVASAASRHTKVDVHGQTDISDADLQLVRARAAAQRKFVSEMSALRHARRLAALSAHAPALSDHELGVALAHCDDDDDACALRLAGDAFVATVRELCAQRVLDAPPGAVPRRHLRTHARALYVRGAFVPPPLPVVPPTADAKLPGRLHAPLDANGNPRQKGFFIESEKQNSTTIEAALAAAAAAAAAGLSDKPPPPRKRPRSADATAADSEPDADVLPEPPLATLDTAAAAAAMGVDDEDDDDVDTAIAVDGNNRVIGGGAAVTTLVTEQQQRESGRLCLDDAVKRAQAGSYDGWSEARKKAFKSMNENPNAYYYRFNAPGEEQKNGHWSADEEKLFFEVAKIYPVNTKWGLFSMHIPGRVGYQCSNFYRQLVRTGRIKDPNYVLDETGRPRFLFKNKQGTTEVRNYKQGKPAAAAAAAAASADGAVAAPADGSDSHANASTSDAAPPPPIVSGGTIISRARKNKLPKEPKPPKAPKEPKAPKPPKAELPPLLDADGNPVARKRGRPRKYPLPPGAVPPEPKPKVKKEAPVPLVPLADASTASTSQFFAQLPLPPPPLPVLFVPPPAVVAAPVAEASTATAVPVAIPAPILVVPAPPPPMLSMPPVEPVFLSNTTNADDAALAAAIAAAEAADAKPAKVKKVRTAAAAAAAAASAAKPKKKHRKGGGDVIWADDVDDTRDDVTTFQVSKRLRGALGVENPLPDYIDPITMLPVVAPMMSPAGIVLGKETWMNCLARKSECPLTKQPVKLDSLTLLTPLNIKRLQDRLKL